jgi:hypothetical protein
MTKSITLRHNSSSYILFQNSKMQDFDATKEGQIEAIFFLNTATSPCITHFVINDYNLVN